MSDTFARYVVGDSLSVLRSLPDRSVQSVISSPPYLAKRSYLPDGHPDKAQEIGQEATPADFLGALLEITDELWRVVRDDGTIWINLGDTASGSGGAGGDYNEGGLRDGQPAFIGSARRTAEESRRGVDARNRGNTSRGTPRGGDWPLAKSVCWIPQLFGASLAYGRNLLSGEPCQQWVTRPPVTWCKPNPPVGEIIDKFREATELIVWAAKTSKPGGYYFDLDSIRLPASGYERPNLKGVGARAADSQVPGQRRNHSDHTCNPKGTPPLDWWEIPTRPYPGSRSSIGIDLDERNAWLAQERVGMFLTVEHFAASASGASA